MTTRPPMVTFESGSLPEAHRLSAFEEAYAQLMVPCHFSALDEQFYTDAAVLPFGPLLVARVGGSSCEIELTASEALHSRPGILFETVLEGFGFVDAEKRKTDVTPGDSLVFNTQESFRCAAMSSYRSVGISIPEAALAGRLGDVGGLRGHLKDCPETQILRSYLAQHSFDELARDPLLRTMVGGHVLDLVVAAVSRGLGLPDPTGGSGARAARLAQIRRMIDRDIAQPTLSAQAIARRLGLTERYVHKLFEAMGTTCAAFIMEKRLMLAYDRLADPAEQLRPVRDIAWAVGFSDASHFTRAFRRRFGETPTAVRGQGGRPPADLAVAAE